MKFYVYVYKDPVTLVPFYVGKGSNGRYKVHVKQAYKKDKYFNHPKNVKIRSILEQTMTPVIIKTQNMSEDDAFELEIFAISEIGSNYTESVKDGSLCNLTEGGGPNSGINNGMYGVDSVVVRDTRNGKFLRVSKEDFKKYDYYVGSTKGHPIYKDINYRESISKRNKNRTHINNGKISKMVKEEEIIHYMIDGWVLGRLGISEKVLGKIHINNGEIRKLINKEDYLSYKNQGYKRGLRL